MLLFEFPHSYTRSSDAPLGSIDELSWIASDEAGSDLHDVPRGAVLYVRGWASNLNRSESAPAIVLSVDDDRLYEARVGLPRLDVGHTFENPALDLCGFEAVIPTGRLLEGRHRLDVFAVEPASRTFAGVADPHRFDMRVSEALVPMGDEELRPTLGSIDGVADETRGGDLLLESGMATAPRGVVLCLRGWVCAAEPLESFRELYLIGGETPAIQAVYGALRTDVAADLGSDIEAVGFEVHLPTADLGRGEHVVELLGRTQSRTLVRTSVSLRLTIGEPLPARVPLPEVTAAFIDEVVRVKSGTALTSAAPLRLVRGDRLFIRGWAFDESAGALAAGVVFVVDDRLEIVALYGLDRPDIAEAFSNSGLARSGFVCEIETHDLPSGYHNADCRVLARDGRGALTTLQRFSFEVCEES